MGKQRIRDLNADHRSRGADGYRSQAATPGRVTRERRLRAPSLKEIQLTFTIKHVMKASNRTRWAWLVATFFGIGDLKPGPGTWASIATALLWWLLATKVLASQQWIACIVLSLLVTAIGIRASTIVANESGVHDPGF